MIDYGKVRSTIKPEEKVIDDYSVWLNTDIQEVEAAMEEETITEYEFNQVRYSKEEYIKMLDDKNADLENEITQAQIAMCEIYEMMG